jgi:hypothetical protein
MSENWLVPKGQMFVVNPEGSSRMMLLHPSDALRVRFGGKLPYESKFDLGVREAERDRRKYGKEQDAYQEGGETQA